MTDDEVLKQYDEMKKMFGPLPNPISEPIRFRYYVKLYNFYTEPHIPSKPA